MLQGFSGADIKLNDNIITKTGNKRLILQAQKQKFFSNFKFDKIGIPEIYSYDSNSIKMRYINGQTFWQFLPYMDERAIELITNALLEFVQFNLQTSTFQLIPFEIIENKLHRIFLKFDYKISHPLEQILNYYAKTDIYLPVGRCHGDLTLSNIIFSQDKIYLIDFLDCFVESPVFDIVKIRQDTERGIINIEQNDIRATTILRRLDAPFSALMDSYGVGHLYNFLQFTNLVRILPYVKEPLFSKILEKIHV